MAEPSAPPRDPTEVLPRRYAALAIDCFFLAVIGLILLATAKHHSYYDAPADGTMQISLIRLRASDSSKRIGSLVLNPGGPGGSGVDYARAARAVVDASVRDFEDASGAIHEVHKLENDGDRLSRDAIASLFHNGIDPMVVIRWKDIYERLEQAIDACERTADVIDEIIVKNR